jgi:hypothetical protein
MKRKERKGSLPIDKTIIIIITVIILTVMGIIIWNARVTGENNIGFIQNIFNFFGGG